MENGAENESVYPEFPLPAYRNLSQVISLPISDGQYSEDIVATTVRIMATPTNLDKTTTMLTLTNVVNYPREERHYSGRLLALSRTGDYLAYVINVPSGDGAVRVCSPTKRTLLKGMKGPIQDLAFSQHLSEVLLAVVDELANLFVYKITDDGELNATELLQVVHNEKSNSTYGHRVIWIPYLRQEGDDEDDLESYRLLALLIGSKAEVWSVGKVAKEHGPNPLNPSDVREGFLEIAGHADIITDAAFSPDGSALATASLEGTLQFFQVYLHKEPKCLHHWKPHDGQPLTFLAFLDNQNELLEDAGFWRFVITGANDNTELKIWNCSDWGHVQTISILGDKNQRLELKASLDYTAKFLLLSDRVNKIFYLFHIVENDSIAYIDSVCAYLLPFSVLSFSIVELSMQSINRSTSNDGDYDEDDDEEDEEIENVATLSIHLVHSKSLQDCKLQFLPPPKGHELVSSTLVPNQMQVPPLPINLMTPKEFTSPAKVETEIIPEPPFPAVIKMEAVDAVVSSASSPSQEVRDILSSELFDDRLIEQNDLRNGYVKKEPADTGEWASSSHRTSQKNSNSVNEATVDSTIAASKVDVSSIEAKLDALIIAMQSQDALIRDLQQRLNKRDEKAESERVERVLATCSQLSHHLSVRDANEPERQEALLSAIAQAFENLLAAKLETVVPSEIRKNVIPMIRADMDLLKRGLHAEMAQALSTTDHLLRENISKLVQSKPMMDLLGKSLTGTLRSSVADACKDIMMTFVLPRLEKVLEKTFQQIHESFAAGTRECLTLVRTDVEQVKGEMRIAERELKEAANRNQNVAATIHMEIEKSLTSVGEKLRLQLAEILQKELKANHVLVDSGANSRAMTPATSSAEVKKTITQWIASGNYNSAFQEALSCSDLSVVVFTCERIPPEELFGRSSTPPLQQPVLLSLIQQLTADLSRHTEIKCSYLTEAVLRLEMSHPLTKDHVPGVLTEVERNISTFISNYPASKQATELTRTLMVLKIFLTGKPMRP